jgi:organic hydroperoxide reductase OsmC/OhrA
MLSFLPLAALAGYEVLRYEDEAVGHMAKTDAGRYWVSEVELRPQITWADRRAPDQATEADLHHRAHGDCYIANSVRTTVRVHPTRA